jgi:hypothetical protein
MKSKFEIGYIVKIKPMFDQSIYNGKEGVIANKRFIGPDCIYTVNVFDDLSGPDSYGRQEARTFFEHELSETKANIRNRKLKEIGI